MPELAIADGALGFWQAIEDKSVSFQVEEQLCPGLGLEGKKELVGLIDRVRFLEGASGNALEVEDQNQHFEAFRSGAHRAAESPMKS
jgi:hypothetical protein